MPTMTSRQRLLAAIRFEGPDRVPVCPRMWRYMLAHGGSQQLPAYLKYAAEYGVDLMIGCSAGPVVMYPDPGSDCTGLGPGFRVEESVAEDNEGRTVSRILHTPAGRLSDRTRIPRPGGQFGIAPNNHIEEYLLKGPDDLPALRTLVSAWTTAAPGGDFPAVRRQLGEQGLVMANTYSAMSHNAGDVYSLDRLMMDCMERQAFVEELMDVFHRPLMEATRRALESGAEMVYCSTFFESMSAGWSPRLYRELFLPRIRAHVELTHQYGALYHLYDDGKVAGTLPMWRETGVDLVSTLCPPPAGDVTLAEARRLAGDDLCLNGGIDTVNTVWRGTPATIEAAIRAAIQDAAGAEGGYILGTSDSITEETPPENFRAFFEAGNRLGARAALTRK
ncbi:MAG: uroporphyrinogen decarboxylase family protein [Candidatus Brocadiia bacterium]